MLRTNEIHTCQMSFDATISDTGLMAYPAKFSSCRFPIGWRKRLPSSLKRRAKLIYFMRVIQNLVNEFCQF